MKVIVASYSKCGTKTLNAALTLLGFKVYDFLENFWYLNDEWRYIMDCGKPNRDLIKRMYQHVDAVVDTPAYLFWNEIHQAFPNAKIILTVRNEDEWCDSFKKQIENVMNNTLFKIILSVAPSGKRLFNYMNEIGRCHFKIYWESPWNKLEVPQKLLRRCYREHNDDVMQNAPKDSLLVYDLKDGWEPLCEFLGVDVPMVDFPHKNVGGKLINTWIREHPFAIRMKKETYAIISFVVVGLLIIAIAACFLTLIL